MSAFLHNLDLNKIKTIQRSNQHKIPYLPFPIKLHQLLTDVEEQGFEDIISWMPDNENAFRVHDRKRFVELVMPRYFRQTHMRSFTRQLRNYGFVRMTRGRGKNSAYHHEQFCRNDFESAKRVGNLNSRHNAAVASADTSPSSAKAASAVSKNVQKLKKMPKFAPIRQSACPLTTLSEKTYSDMIASAVLSNAKVGNGSVQAVDALPSSVVPINSIVQIFSKRVSDASSSSASVLPPPSQQIASDPENDDASQACSMQDCTSMKAPLDVDGLSTLDATHIARKQSAVACGPVRPSCYNSTTTQRDDFEGQGYFPIPCTTTGSSIDTLLSRHESLALPNIFPLAGTEQDIEAGKEERRPSLVSLEGWDEVLDTVKEPAWDSDTNGNSNGDGDDDMDIQKGPFLLDDALPVPVSTCSYSDTQAVPMHQLSSVPSCIVEL